MSAAPPGDGLVATLLTEILRDGHRYAPGVEQQRPTNVARSGGRGRRLMTLTREWSRDLLERAAARAGFSHPHFDPAVAATRLQRVLALGEGLEGTYALLSDDYSRRALIDILKLRVLGPYHTPLRITPRGYRARQAYADRQLRLTRDTYAVSDPWFSPLSLYRIALDTGSTITLHSHSVDVVSVFLLGQYGYRRGPQRVIAGAGEAVLDIGGCWGDTALYFADLVGPAGKVYTFEFDPESLEVLAANLALNQQLAGRVEVVRRALWDRSGETLQFAQAGRMTSVMPTTGNRRTPEVRTLSVDDFVEQAAIDTLGFIKMDVEGAELDVLRGCRNTLERFAPKLAIAAYHRDDDLVRIPQEIDSLQLGYRFFLETFSPVEEETVLFAVATDGAS